MEELKIPAFGESCIFNQSSESTRVFLIPEAGEQAFSRYAAQLTAIGYIQKEEKSENAYRYAAFLKGNEGAFLNYFAKTDELFVALESDCRYFDFADMAGAARVAPQITQVSLLDFGMSYVIRLSDGRFLVIDGGFNYEADVEKLYGTLCEGADGEKPVIAAWIMSHPHEDHYMCFIGFMEKHAQDVEIERFMFHFPRHDDVEHYPFLPKDNSRIKDSSAMRNIPIMRALIETTGAAVFTPHTGQKYCIGDACLEFLATMDDTIHRTKDGNATSLIFRMTLGGQTVLWTGDAGCSHARLAERYGEGLRSDILQVPHHGFQCGTAEGEIAAYELIQPDVCLLPAADYTTYTFFCQFREGTRHLMQMDCLRELITGSTQRTLTLPYTAKAGAKEQIAQEMDKGAVKNGADIWIFSELSTPCEALEFSILNATVLPAEVTAELYFEDKKDMIRAKLEPIPGRCVQKRCLMGGENAAFDMEALPKNAFFAVRFRADKPVVVAHKSLQASYHN